MNWINLVIASSALLISIHAVQCVRYLYNVTNDIEMTAVCINGGNTVENRDEEYNRVCLLDGKPWVSWKREY
jgi:hypothetical protein